MAVVLMGIIVLATIAQKLLFRYAFHEDDDGTGTSKRAQKRALKRNRYSSERRSVSFAKTDGKVRPFSKMQVKPVSAADTERSR
jgi:hypothetical protein